jgi:hypothetical protein
LFAVLFMSVGCRAEGVPETSPNENSSVDLVETPNEFDGEEVAFQGEVIGEAMERGDMAWLHINDDAYYLENVEEGAQLGGYNTGMAVWLPATETDSITYYGDHTHEGDIVEVVGTFNAACAEHGGDLDIHASRLTIIEPGHPVIDQVRPAKVLWAVGLAALAAGLYVTTRMIGRAS